MNDADLLRITDGALGDAYARAGEWMACRPGCTPCCIGVFPISRLDVHRLREGLAQAPPAIVAAVRGRAAASWARLAPSFPGNAETGELFTREGDEAAFEGYGNDEPCPVLDPATGRCALYAARPIPCRTFGPPMPNDEGGLAVCELCFMGAPQPEVVRCTVDAAGFLEQESILESAFEEQTGERGPSLIAFALGRPIDEELRNQELSAAGPPQPSPRLW